MNFLDLLKKHEKVHYKKFLNYQIFFFTETFESTFVIKLNPFRKKEIKLYKIEIKINLQNFDFWTYTSLHPYYVFTTSSSIMQKTK